MMLLSDQQREVLVEVGEPGAGPVFEWAFRWAIGCGYGLWAKVEGEDETVWMVTAAGREALARDDVARAALGASR